MTSADPVSVRLLVDMSRYHPGLKEGVIGKARVPTGERGSKVNRFVIVEFENIKMSVDVLWRHLEVIS